MNRRQVRKLAQSTLRSLDLQPPLDVQQLVERLGQRRGRPIILAPSEGLLGRQQFGFTWNDPAAGAIVIMFESGTTWRHQMMIILHELAHLICDHPGHAIDHSYRADHASDFQEISPAALAEVLGPRPRPRRQRRGGGTTFGPTTFGPSLYDEPAEWEAETMATIMTNWVPGIGGYHAPPARDRLGDILGDAEAW